jgi:hypothetical protein
MKGGGGAVRESNNKRQAMLRINPRSCLFWAAGLLSFFSMLLSDACSPKNGHQFLGGVFLSALNFFMRLGKPYL